MTQVAEDLKKTMGTEEEPFEGEVPLADVEAEIMKQVKAAPQSCFIFDSWLHKSCEEFLKWACHCFGVPSFAVHCNCDRKHAEERFKKANETEEINEDQVAELEESNRKAEKNNSDIQNMFGGIKDKVRLISLSTEGSNEAIHDNLKSNFAAKIILINHEKRLQVDTQCSNLAIKYNMLYVSVY